MKLIYLIISIGSMRDIVCMPDILHCVVTVMERSVTHQMVEVLMGELIMYNEKLDIAEQQRSRANIFLSGEIKT